MSERASRRRSASLCCTKYPPRGKPPLPKHEDGEGLLVRFGRQRSTVFPPSKWRPKKSDAATPDTSLKREYVYGYNGDCRNSLHFISETEIVYPIACLVVILDVVTNQQRFFEGHSNDVKCLAWNDERGLCISGQMDVKGTGGPKACVWSPQRPGKFCDLPHPDGSRSLSAAALSPDGSMAVTFATDDARSFYIWRADFSRAAQKGASLTPIFSGSSGRQSTLGIFMSSCSSHSLSFSTVGEGHFKSWLVQLPATAPVTVTQKRGVYGKNPARNPLGWAWRGEDGSAWLVADNGLIYQVMNHSATASKQLAPNSALSCVAKLPGGRWLAAAADGTIYLGSAGPSLKLEEEIAFTELKGDAKVFASTSTARFNAISVCGDLVVLGSSNHALFLVNHVKRELVRVLQVSHTTEAFAMDFHPNLAILATASARGGVRFWNVADRRPAVGKVLRSDVPVRSLAFQKDGSLLAIGMDKGILEVNHFPSLQPAFRERLSRPAERISVVCFSSCGGFLAAGSWDQQVYLLRVEESQVRLHRVLAGNTSSITALMFSADSHYLMSNSRDCQILHWSVKDGMLQHSSAVFRETRWQTPWTCVLGWPVVGIWADGRYDASDVNSACQAYAPHNDVLAFGDDYGNVKLIRFPSPFANPGVQVSAGHASFVTAVRFSPNNVLVTLGGDDHSIMQWSLQPTEGVDDMTITMHRPFVDLEGSEAPQDRFAFLGKRPEEPSSPRPRVFQDLNQIQSEKRLPVTPPARTEEKPYHRNQSYGVGDALKWD